MPAESSLAGSNGDGSIKLRPDDGGASSLAGGGGGVTLAAFVRRWILNYVFLLVVREHPAFYSYSAFLHTSLLFGP